MGESTSSLIYEKVLSENISTLSRILLNRAPLLSENYS